LSTEEQSSGIKVWFSVSGIKSAVGEAVAAVVPDATIISGEGRTLLPGLIDSLYM
jgi:imidazolonepropionase-like amidohydrolase